MNISNILECTICSTNYYIFEGPTYYRCIPVCPNEYYKGTSSPLRCERCISNCLICNDGDTCIECKPGSFIKSSICVSDCGAGYYPNVSTGTCNPCSANCITCTASGCSQCDASTYYQDGVCVLACGVGYLANTTTRICESCPINCQTCAYINSVLTCTECLSGAHMKGVDCLSDCGSGYYSNSITKQCDACITTDCDICGSDLICTRCLAGLGLQDINGVKVCEVCPSKTYLSSGVCNNCINLCEICTNGASCTTCITNAGIRDGVCKCGYNYIESNGSCVYNPEFKVTTCGMSTGGVLYVNFNRELKVAPSASDIRVRLGTTDYDSLHFTIYQTAMTNIVVTMNDMSVFIGHLYALILFPSAPNQLLSKNDDPLLSSSGHARIFSSYNTALSCADIPNCNVCLVNYDTKKDCIECNTNYCVLIADPNTCSGCCDPGYYQARADRTDCSICPSKCATCNRSGCTSCNTGTYLINNDCRTTCGVKYFENSNDNTCTPCLSNCDHCVDGLTCSRCSTGYILSNGNTACLPCSTGTYFFGGVCIACPSICAACSSNLICTSCISNAEVRSDKMCYCSLGYIYTNNQCVLTLFHARAKIDINNIIFLSFEKQLINSITSSDIDFPIARAIDTTFTLSETVLKQVYEIVIPGLSYSGVDSFILNIVSFNTIYAVDQSKLADSFITVYICPIGCDTCTADQCLSCIAGYFLKNYVCVLDCGLYYVGNTITNECEECPNGCEICEFVRNDLVCFICMTGYTLDIVSNNYVCERCLDGNYVEFNQCLPCPNLCSSCTADLGCTACNQNSYLDGAVCVMSYGTILPSAIMNTEGDIILTFNKSLIASLSPNSISFTIKSTTYLSSSFLIVEDRPSYIYNISLLNIDLSGISLIYLNFINTESIISEDYSILLQTSLTITVPTEIGCPYACSSCRIYLDTYICIDCKLGYSMIYDGQCIEPLTLCNHHYMVNNEVLCAKCKKFAFKIDEKICECYDIVNQIDKNRCPESCPEGMKVDKDLFTCVDVAESDSSNTDNDAGDNDSEDSDSEESNDDSADNNMNGEDNSSNSSNSSELSNLFNAVMITNTVNSVVSVASSEGNGWSLIGTIQIFSFLPLLAVEVTLTLKTALGSHKNYLLAYDILKTVYDSPTKPYKQARDFKYEYASFILNSGKPLFILICIVLIQLLLNILSKRVRNDIKEKLNNINKMFYFGIYLRYFITIYLELAISSMLQLYYVIFI